MLTNSEFDARFSLTSLELEESDKARISTTYFRDFRRDLLSTFLIVTFLTTGMAWFVLHFLTSYQFTSLKSLVVGSAVALLSVVYMFVKEAKHAFALRSDLKNGRYQQVSVRPKLAIAVDLPNGQHAIALDCDKHTLLLVGGWWKHLQRDDILWEKTNARKNFPSIQFSISRLPKCGRVFLVTTDGPKLRITWEKPMEPELQIEIDNYLDSYVVDQPLSSIELRRCPTG